MARPSRPPSVALLVAIAAPVALAACSGPSGTDASGSRSGDALVVEQQADAVVCDGTEREAAVIAGAQPGERIDVTSALPVDVESGVADEDGRYRLLWTCQPPEARLRWDLTVTGRRSERAVDLTIAGTATDPATGDALTVTLFDDEVRCDGVRRDVGTIDGGDPEEPIVFTSDQTSRLQPGTADDRGRLVFGWTCRPDDDGRSWEVTATGQRSGRAATFVLRGATPDLGPAEVIVTEDPFVCNGQRRTFAVVTNLVPGELVSLTAPGVEGLRDGRVAADGELALNWQCGPDEIGRTWTLTAIGAESGLTAMVTFTGMADPGGPAVRPGAEATLQESPFACDGERRPVAIVSGMLPREFVDFRSPDTTGLREGRADELGELVVSWQCDPTELGPGGSRRWEVTATGRQSSRSVTFEIDGTR